MGPEKTDGNSRRRNTHVFRGSSVIAFSSAANRLPDGFDHVDVDGYFVPICFTSLI